MAFTEVSSPLRRIAFKLFILPVKIWEYPLFPSSGSYLCDLMSEPSAEFIQAYTGCQSRLYAFLMSLLGDAEQAREVLQETNLVIWRKYSDFEPGTNFMAWVLRIARYQVMAYRKRQARDQLVFGDSVQQHIDQAFVRYDAQAGDRQHLLHVCLKLLSPHARELVRRRYENDQGLKTISQEIGRSYQAVGQALRRIRIALAKCVKEREAQNG